MLCVWCLQCRLKTIQHNRSTGTGWNSIQRQGEWKKKNYMLRNSRYFEYLKENLSNVGISLWQLSKQYMHLVVIIWYDCCRQFPMIIDQIYTYILHKQNPISGVEDFFTFVKELRSFWLKNCINWTDNISAKGEAMRN